MKAQITHLVNAVQAVTDWVDEWGMYAKDYRDQEEVEARLNQLRSALSVYQSEISARGKK